MAIYFITILGELKVQKEILENAHFSLIPLQAKVPPSLQITVQIHGPWTHEREQIRHNITTIHHVSFTGEKTL